MTTFEKQKIEEIRQFIYIHNRKLEIEKYGIDNTEQQELERILQTALREQREIIEKEMKIKGAEEYFQLIDREFESFNIDVAVGEVLQKYRQSLAQLRKEEV